MPKSEQEIIKFLVGHIQKYGSDFRNWYVGIASDPKSRLFNEHCVSKENDRWGYDNAGSEQSARNIEEFIITNYNTDGGGGGDINSTWVYVYKKTYFTRP
jgi:hypothetical protein